MSRECHQIYSNDNVVMAGQGAWHGLGKVVEGAPNPFAALRLAELEWRVLESTELNATFVFDGTSEQDDDYDIITAPAHKMLMRSDDKTVLGIVGKDYVPVQNEQIAELAYAFRKAGEDVGVEVESAGSIKQGRRVWMLLRAPSIDMTGFGDMAAPYLFIANSHDATMALRVKPVSVRVVCNNTFNAALRGKHSGWAFRHTYNINNKVDVLKSDIDRWYATVQAGRDVAKTLAATQVNRDKVRDLWADVLMRLDGPTPSDPKDGWEQRKKDRAVGFLATCARVFDEEGAKYGFHGWTAVNAATNAIQHYRAGLAMRGSRNDSQARAYAAWDGATADATDMAFEIALQTL